MGGNAPALVTTCAPDGTAAGRPGYYPLTLYRGDSYAWQFRVWENTEMTDPGDLTDATAKAQITTRPGDPPVLDMTCVVTLPNVIDMTLDAADWVGTDVPRTGAWDLQITWSTSGRVLTLVGGPVTVVQDVTVA
jgi:hypothetical protein